MSLNITEKTLQLLLEDEKYEPENVFANFFEFAKLNEVKETFAELKRAVVEKKFCFENNSMEEEDMLYFFEKLEKLVEAAWMMKK